MTARIGLNSPSFEGEIYTTAVTKALLLGTMEAGDRVLHEEFPGNARKYKFANLKKVQRGNGAGSGRSGGDRIVSCEMRLGVARELTASFVSNCEQAEDPGVQQASGD